MNHLHKFDYNDAFTLADDLSLLVFLGIRNRETIVLKQLPHETIVCENNLLDAAV